MQSHTEGQMQARMQCHREGHVKKQPLNKIMAMGAVGFMLLNMTGCIGTKYLSEGISEAGHVQPANVVFPALDDAWQKQGQFANSENLSKIKPGVSKDELYQLIGRPHFSEAQHAREWDYILKFYLPDESIKTCQYKVIFDKSYKGQEFYWYPADCPPQKPAPVLPAAVVAPAPVLPVAVAVVPDKQRINLSADALFGFDKWELADMLPQGRSELDALAQKLRGYQQTGETQIVVTGHSDYLGDDKYNMNLSQLRAQTVRQYLVNQGIDPKSMLATGAGESEPVSQCAQTQPRDQLIACLQPNRRVTLDVSIIK